MKTIDDVRALMRPCQYCANLIICVTTGPVPSICAADYDDIALDMILKGEY